MWRPLSSLFEILPEQSASTAPKGKKRKRAEGASSSATPTGSSRQSASAGPFGEGSRSVDGQQGDGTSTPAPGGRRGTKETYATEDLDTREQRKVTSTRNFDNVKLRAVAD